MQNMPVLESTAGTKKNAKQARDRKQKRDLI